ncbi:N-acetylmuramoyl-L-alanine amidase [Hymenobacter psychrotolerans]|uniref:N-acetylmuramoyl-L-alanine amidase n=1 Tax=Hymenobacter psychrotolerans DSM 18569 TaxID=1121959 RepID=A0A1M7CJI5_9BACT|nr:N-acetylmuramoyl-L-alanine amidase [Hymenobacter psychrotolerans]SHL66969.1 N-acetylmuramoyl-L-alanine amidase [Hymenobacter psychrotolerans DSM 18569]
MKHTLISRSTGLALLLLLLNLSAACAQRLIRKAETLPAGELWLSPGDALQLRLAGPPGGQASFLNGLPMTELPPEQAGGVAGIYQATYHVQPTDTLGGAGGRPLWLHLRLPDGRHDSLQTAAPVRVLSPNQPQLAVTQGALAHLNYGLGEDRLGGAKLGYLDSLVVLHVVGRVAGQYRVRLAEGQYAWAPLETVRLLPAGGFQPASLTGSWSVAGDSLYDYVRLPLTQRLPYRSQLLQNPARLVIDVFGATSNTNWITQRAGLRELGAIYYEQPQPDVFRMVLPLRHLQSWGYHIRYERNTLLVQVSRPPARLRLKGLVVAVDAGHGGTNVGAIGPSGAREKDLTLAIARQLRRELERQGARVLMTRDADVTVGNAERVQLLRQRRPALLVSIHVNSSGSAAAQGTSTYYRYVAFRPLAQALYGRMQQTRLKGWGLVGNFNFGLNGPTEYPNALVETAFVSNPEDEQRLTDPEQQRQMARRMAQGIEDFLKSSRAPGPKGWLRHQAAEQ